MTDLATKFTSLESQLAAQHGENLIAMNAILAALGAPPATPTTTLTDVLNALNAIAMVLTGLRLDMADQHAAQLTELQTITTTLELINNNASLNAQRLLLAIAANDPCKSCEITPIEPPPISVTPQIIDTVHCKRMQALIYALKRMTVKLDVLSTFGVGFSVRIISDAFTEIWTELSINGLVAMPSASELAFMLSAAAAYAVSNALVGGSLPASFQSISDDLLPALYAADNASAGQAGYNAVIDASDLPSAVKNLFKAMAYRELWNYYYDPTKQLDLAGFDGSICAPAEVDPCVTLVSQPDATGQWWETKTPRPAILWAEPFVAQTDQPNGYIHTGPAICLTDLYHYTVRKVSGSTVRVVAWNSSGGILNNIQLEDQPDQTFFFFGNTTHVLIDSLPSNTDFSIELCPPAS